MVILLPALVTTLRLSRAQSFSTKVLGPNVTLINPSGGSQVFFSETEDNFTAVFYESECSDIETITQSLNYTRTLDATERQYRIDEFYSVKNSIIKL